MIPFTKIARLFTVLAAVLITTGAVRAASGGIHDNGAFFSEKARAEASRIIGDLGRSVKKDVVIETFQEIPADAKGGAIFADKAATNQFFEQWAAKQAREQNVNGIYILLVKQPAHLQAVVGNQTLKQAFTSADRDTLVSTMLTRLRARQNDSALLEGVNFAAATMRAHATGTTRGEARPAGQESSTGWILPLLIGGVVLWLVFGLLRSLLGGGANPAGMPQGVGGSGFGRSLLGGLFGAAAGMWMYDQFFGSHGHASSVSEQNGPTGGDSGFSGQDTDYSGSGGGFGDDSGGGFGDGDSGGGGDF